MILLAETSGSPSQAMIGMVVIVLLQLSQFIFAWRKDQRSQESAKKEDLKALRSELKSEIDALEQKVDRSLAEGNRVHAELHGKINKVGLDTAALLKGQQLVEQSLISMGTKLDTLAARPRTR